LRKDSIDRVALRIFAWVGDFAMVRSILE